MSTMETPETISQSEIYRVGTLEYTKRGLYVLFVWLLWGDFCFTLMEGIFPVVMPITMRNLGSSNLLVGLITLTIPQILNTVMCPWLSFKSDRYRSKWGRRKPFLLFPTPFVAVLLVLMGLAPDMGRYLHQTLLHASKFSQTTIVLGLLAVFSVIYQFFNMFALSIYYYLFNDVVPEQYIGRFMALFRVVGTLAGCAFTWWILPHAETHMKWIFVGAGLVYLVAFGAMALKVKEGEYPPPPENVDKKVGLISAIKTYFTECYTHKFYWYFILAITSWELTYCMGAFIIFVRHNGLGLSLLEIGKMMTVGQLLTALLLYPAGMLTDKKHPIRTAILATAGLTLIQPLRMIFVVHNFDHATTYKIEFGLYLLMQPLMAILIASNLPLYMRLLPKERYGQFASSQAGFRALLTIGFSALAGIYLDVMKRVCAAHHLPEFYYYRWGPAWYVVFTTISLLFLLKVYKYWKAFGGDESYTPPGFPPSPQIVEESEPALVGD